MSHTFPQTLPYYKTAILFLKIKFIGFVSCMKSPFLPVTFFKSENYVQGKNSEKGGEKEA